MKALVTGGGGFVGSHLVKALLARGDQVRILARGAYPELVRQGAESVRGDVRDVAGVTAAARGMDVVFHTAAKAGGWGNRHEFEDINVSGTENVIAACKVEGVPSLVHTSSPSVVVTPRDIAGDDESIPYATKFMADYPRTKALAEARVLGATSQSLRTVALRPHLIWGPGDRHLLPRLVERSRTGRLRRIGRRDPLTDTTYIDNCIDAHLLAHDALRRKDGISGRAYFISDGSPIGVWTMVSRVLEAAGESPIRGSVPAWLAYGIGGVLEAVYGVAGIEREPFMTRFAASQLSHAQWFDITAARRDLGYTPRVSIDTGMALLKTWARTAFPR